MGLKEKGVSGRRSKESQNGCGEQIPPVRRVFRSYGDRKIHLRHSLYIPSESSIHPLLAHLRYAFNDRFQSGALHPWARASDTTRAITNGFLSA